VTLTLEPKIALAAVAPSATIAPGETASSSASSQGLQASISPARGVWVQPSLAARAPLKVLDRVGQVDRVSVDPRLGQGAIEHCPGRADERLPLTVLAIARLLADQDQLSLRRALPEDGLCGVLPKRASAAAGGRAAQRRQGVRLGQKVRRRSFHGPYLAQPSLAPSPAPCSAVSRTDPVGARGRCDSDGSG
jgi:hypothetical protein